MGTRNLTMVKVDGKIKVAQYGQWDGYPTGQGITVAEFVQAYLVDDALCAEFAEKMRKVKKATKRQAEKTYADWTRVEKEIKQAGKDGEYVPNYRLDFFKWYNRDTGAKILKMLFDAPEPPPLHYELKFLKDTLFCEWAYCINLDNGSVNVYRGTTHPVRVIAFANFTVRRMRTLGDEIDVEHESVHSILTDNEVA